MIETLYRQIMPTAASLRADLWSTHGTGLRNRSGRQQYRLATGRSPMQLRGKLHEAFMRRSAVFDVHYRDTRSGLVAATRPLA
jgi:hypothetical protein